MSIIVFRFFVMYVTILVLCAFNPWIEYIRLLAYVFLALELVLFVFLAFPVFVFMIAIKKKSFKASVVQASRFLIPVFG
jgi:hypothetical protein